MNKPRLIDANALLRHLSDWWLSETPSGEVTVINNIVQKTPTNEIIEECIKAVEEQPTAYNIDKVVEQLEECSVNYCKEYDYAEDENVLYLPDAIEIVKGGAGSE